MPISQEENKEIIEELSETLSFKLAQKLRNKEIGMEKMAGAIQAFFYKIKTAESIEEIKKLVNDL